ncbi:SDR family NAD(P)-dependent oxidoreductase [Xanthobacteraceae bacterium Astr-EGSB]|uniref:SDR family NAD(P)-dependent oxidoreductase n=1 Tax=Astrobacterium formosum TaxID=3069710 RepID=UPI0027B5D335|nr:SDR family NAD(P)-dependent oxidoreductase [Xanthobacteraceae bacterium Astr-EGSB]
MTCAQSAPADGEFFRDRTVVVTGGASGIGRAVVEALLGARARVAVFDLRPDALSGLARQHGERLRVGAVDVADRPALEDAMAAVADAWGGISHLVNSAGIIGRRAPLAALDEADLERVLATNLKSVFYAGSAFVRMGAGLDARSIVNMSSIAARTGGMAGNMAYAASKGAVATLTIAMAKELAPDIRVNALAPGIIDTPMQLDSIGDPAAVAALSGIVPLRRLGTAAEVAGAAIWLLSPAAAYITGTILDVAGGR